MKVNKADQYKIVEYPELVVTSLYLITGERMFVNNISKKVAQAFSNCGGKAYGALW